MALIMIAYLTEDVTNSPTCLFSYTANQLHFSPFPPRRIINTDHGMLRENTVRALLTILLNAQHEFR